jgi:hypothetical protein
MSNKTYEEEFSLEMSKAKEGKAKAAPWSSGYKKAPEILHGYDKKVKGKTAEERLDMRSGTRQGGRLEKNNFFGFLVNSKRLSF